MNTTPKPTRRGGARIGVGRRKVGRRSIVVRIKAEILEKLSPNAALNLPAVAYRKGSG